MAGKYKTTHRIWFAWDYQNEIKSLDLASENGWQLVKGGCFRSKFVSNPDIRYRYQIDYRKVDDMGRYIETFREQGWEYVSSTFNGWHYFRKMYDPSLPEEAYEIFTDNESLHEMRNRWSRLALILGIICGLCAVVCLIGMILRPALPMLLSLLSNVTVSVVLLRGRYLMRHREAGSGRRNVSTFATTFLCVIAVLSITNLALTNMRPRYSSQQNADWASLQDNQWFTFDVKYTDNYYLGLDIDADAPVTFELLNENGEVMYSETGTDVHKENIRVRLKKGQYRFSETVEGGYELNVSIE